MLYRGEGGTPFQKGFFPFPPGLHLPSRNVCLCGMQRPLGCSAAASVITMACSIQARRCQALPTARGRAATQGTRRPQPPFATALSARLPRQAGRPHGRREHTRHAARHRNVASDAVDTAQQPFAPTRSMVPIRTAATVSARKAILCVVK